MKVSKIAAAIALFGMMGPVAAQAGEGDKAAGRVASATKGVFISRNGKLIPATAGQTLYKGDRVVSRADAKAQLAMNGCSVALAPTSIVSVADNCAQPQTLAASSAGLKGANGVDATTAVVVVLAVAAAGAGLYAGLDSSSEPTSP